MAWDSNFALPKSSFLDAEQLAGVRALFRAIQPADPERGIPGADDCDAANFLGLLLARDNNGDAVRVHHDLPKWREGYPGWLRDLDSVGRARFGKPLANLGVDEAGALLADLEAATLVDFPGDQRRVFATLWRHCLQGCWSDPRWGGNRERLMWRWLGHLYDPQTVPVASHGGSHAAD